MQEPEKTLAAQPSQRVPTQGSPFPDKELSKYTFVEASTAITHHDETILVGKAVFVFFHYLDLQVLQLRVDLRQTHTHKRT